MRILGGDVVATGPGHNLLAESALYGANNPLHAPAASGIRLAPSSETAPSVTARLDCPLGGASAAAPFDPSPTGPLESRLELRLAWLRAFRELAHALSRGHAPLMSEARAERLVAQYESLPLVPFEDPLWTITREWGSCDLARLEQVQRRLVDRVWSRPVPSAGPLLPEEVVSALTRLGQRPLSVGGLDRARGRLGGWIVCGVMHPDATILTEAVCRAAGLHFISHQALVLDVGLLWPRADAEVRP